MHAAFMNRLYVVQGHISPLFPHVTMATVPSSHYLLRQTKLIFIIFNPPRSPALIGCFVVDRLYFEEIGLLDEGMEVYGGENVELGIRVSHNVIPRGHGPLFIQVMCGELTTIMTLNSSLEQGH